jgi:hypothetical protein
MSTSDLTSRADTEISWRWIFIWQGIITCLVAAAGYVSPHPLELLETMLAAADIYAGFHC